VRHHGWLPDLDRERDPGTLSLRIVKDRLAVEPDDFGHEPRRLLGPEGTARGEGRVAAQLDVKRQEIAHRHGPLLRAEHPLAERRGIALVMPRDEPGPPRRGPTLHGDERSVRAVGGRAGHDAERAGVPRCVAPAHLPLPWRIPSTICRWKRRKARRTGTVVRVEPARSAPQSTLCSPCAKSASPTGSVRIDSEVVRTSG